MKKRYFLISLIYFGSLFLLNSCDKSTSNATAQEQETENKEAPLEDKFYKRMEGKIGDNLSIVMHLTRVDSVIKGVYYYTNKQIPIQLNGKIDILSGVWTVTESTPVTDKEGYKDWVETGVFEGTWQKGEWKGNWKNKKTVLPFAVSVAYPEGTVKASMVGVTTSFIPDPKKPEVGVTASCGYPELTTGAGKGSINKSITTLIRTNYDQEGGKPTVFATDEEMLEDFVKTYKADRAEMGEEGSDLPYESDYQLRIETNEHNILGVTGFAYFYTGGAHGSAAVENANYDTQTGKKLTLADVLVNGFDTKLTALGEKYFREQNNVGAKPLIDAGYDFGDDGKFYLPEAFLIRQDGILFTYGQYEIGPYAMGMPEVLIPYSELGAIVKKEGALGWILK